MVDILFSFIKNCEFELNYIFMCIFIENLFIFILQLKIYLKRTQLFS